MKESWPERYYRKMKMCCGCKHFFYSLGEKGRTCMNCEHPVCERCITADPIHWPGGFCCCHAQHLDRAIDSRGIQFCNIDPDETSVSWPEQWFNTDPYTTSEEYNRTSLPQYLKQPAPFPFAHGRNRRMVTIPDKLIVPQLDDTPTEDRLRRIAINERIQFELYRDSGNHASMTAMITEHLPFRWSCARELLRRDVISAAVGPHLAFSPVFHNKSEWLSTILARPFWPNPEIFNGDPENLDAYLWLEHSALQGEANFFGSKLVHPPTPGQYLARFHFEPATSARFYAIYGVNTSEGIIQRPRPLWDEDRRPPISGYPHHRADMGYINQLIPPRGDKRYVQTGRDSDYNSADLAEREEQMQIYHIHIPDLYLEFAQDPESSDASVDNSSLSSAIPDLIDSDGNVPADRVDADGAPDEPVAVTDAEIFSCYTGTETYYGKELYEHANLVNGYGILDIGCSKGLISEHALRGLVQAQKKNGVKCPVRRSTESTAKFTFGDGSGNATKAGRKVTVAVNINGSPFETEFECLEKGKTPPLISLPQMENLEIDLKLRPGCSTISSARLGFENKPLERQNGHVVLNLAELMGCYTVEKINARIADPQQNLAPKITESGKNSPDEDTQETLIAPAAADEDLSRFSVISNNNTDSLYAAWDAILDQDELLSSTLERSLLTGDDASYPDTESADLSSAELALEPLTALEFSGIFNTEELKLSGENSHDALQSSFLEAEELLRRCNEHVTAANAPDCLCSSEKSTDPLHALEQIVHGTKNLKNNKKQNKNKTNNKSKKGNKTLPPSVGSPPSPSRAIGTQAGPSRKTVPGGVYTEAELLKIHTNWNHCSAEQMKRRLKWGSFPQPRLSIQALADVLTKCPNRHCQALVHAPRRPKTSGIVPETRNQFVAQDTVFPIARGRKWCVQHRVDCLTKLQTVHASSTNKATDSIRAQQDWFTWYGPNKFTLTDNGPEFCCSDYTEHCQRNGTEHYTSPAYCGFSNGMIERSHQECKRLFELVSTAHPRLPIVDVAKVVQQALNESIKQNGRSSFENHFGKPARRPDFKENPVLWEDAISEHQQLFEAALDTSRVELIKLRTDAALRKALQSQQNRSTGNFTQGDKVWWFKIGKPNELPRWHGPARCVARQGSTAVIMDGGVAHMVHVSRVRCFRDFPSDCDENDSLIPSLPCVRSENSLQLGGSAVRPRTQPNGVERGGLPSPSPGVARVGLPAPTLPASTPRGASQRSRSVDFDLSTFQPQVRQGRSYLFKDLREMPKKDTVRIDAGRLSLDSAEIRPSDVMPIPAATDTTDVPVLGKDVPRGIPSEEEISPTPRPQAGVRPELSEAENLRQRSQESKPPEFRISGSSPPPERDTFGDVFDEGFDSFVPTSPLGPRPKVFRLDSPQSPEDLDISKTFSGAGTPARAEPDDLAEIILQPDVAADGAKLLHPGVPENPAHIPQFPYPFEVNKLPSGVSSGIPKPPEYGPVKRIRNKPEHYTYGPGFKEKRVSALVGNVLDELKETSELYTGKSACAALLEEMRVVPNLPKPDLGFLYDTSMLSDHHDPTQHLAMACDAMVRELDILENCYKSRLVAEDTPMRDMRKEEIDKFSELVDAAEKTEFDSFLENDAIDFITKDEVHKMGRRILKTRQLMQWKEFRRKVKCRVVLKGFQDDRDLGAVDSPTLRQESFRLLLQYSCDLKWDLLKDDLKTAFLQGFLYDDVEDRVYFHPTPKMRQYYGMAPNEVCVAKRSIYGLNDAPRRWYERLSQGLMENGWERHWLDPCLFLRYDKPATPANHQARFNDIESAGNRHMQQYTNRTCIGAIGVHVDDLIRTGTPKVLTALDALLDRIFTVGTRESAAAPGPGFLYRGLRVRKPDREHCIVDMHEYIDRELRIKYQPVLNRSRKTAQDSETTLDVPGQEWYRAAIGKLIWCTCQVRLDLSTAVSQAASHLGRATLADAITVNGLLQQALDRKIEIKFAKISYKSRKRVLRVCCDAAFKNKTEANDKSRGGMMLLLGADLKVTDTQTLLGWSSKKIQRVCKSPTGAEVLTVSAAVDELDFAYHLAVAFYTDDLEYTSEIFTDSLSLTSTQEKYTKEINPNLQVDVSIIRQKVRNGDTRLLHIPGKFNPSDGLTKIEYGAQQSLLNFLEKWRIGKDGTPYENIEGLFSELMDRMRVKPEEMEKSLREYVKSLEL